MKWTKPSEDMLVNPDTKWKYCRVASSTYFDTRRYTPLSVYLHKIYPDNQFIYNAVVPDRILEARGSVLYTTYKVAARCEELNLIVEVDTIEHYQDKAIMDTDAMMSEYFKALGYNVIRIPFWLPLSRNNIKYLFNVDVHDFMCQLRYSFYDSDDSGKGLFQTPGEMSERGRDKFLAEFNALPDESKMMVQDDLKACCMGSDCIRYVLPGTLIDIVAKPTNFDRFCRGGLKSLTNLLTSKCGYCTYYDGIGKPEDCLHDCAVGILDYMKSTIDYTDLNLADSIIGGADCE